MMVTWQADPGGRQTEAEPMEVKTLTELMRPSDTNECPRWSQGGRALRWSWWDFGPRQSQKGGGTKCS